jgi:hypothetical protein
MKTPLSRTASTAALAALALAAQPAALRAATTTPEAAPAPEQVAFFEEKIRPVLVEHCYKCHSADAQKEGKLKGGLFLDTREGIRHGGDSGPAVVAGKPGEGHLLKSIRWEDADTQMPPKKKLPPEVIADFEKWIALGAADPRDGSKGQAKREINLAAGREHWAFKPLARVAPPTVKNAAWAKTSVDRFVSAKQEEAGITPAAPLPREKLIRRAYFDLLGLPPTPEEVAAFVKDPAPDAFAKLVDRLLESPQYGERWGRHWLDVVRFGESNGYEFDAFRPAAYHYRDWVIRALNADLPYDEFVKQQFAGDLLAQNRAEGAAATGFWVAGPYPGQITAKTAERIRYDQLDDMISTAGGAMLGLTLGCVRCHDHKYDPIPQTDYYALAADLKTTAHAEIRVDQSSPERVAQRTAHLKQREKLVAELKTYSNTELENRFQAWKTSGLPPAPTAAQWQLFDSFRADAEMAWLERSADGMVRYMDRKSADDTYTIKVRTFQKGIRGFRLDALSDPALPGKGPGLAANGSFSLADFKVIATPIDSSLKEKPKTLKLKAVQASFEQKGNPLANAVDPNAGTVWAIAPETGKDHAAIFGIDGDPVHFEGGTEFEIRLAFKNGFGLGKFRISFANEETLPGLDASCEPQALREIHAMVGEKAELPAMPRREMFTHWFARFDDRAQSMVQALHEHDRQEPRPDNIRVYSVTNGGRDVFLLRRGEVDNKAGKAEPGFIQVLSTAPAERWLQPNTVNPRVALGRWMTDSEAGAGHLLARVMVNRVWKHHFGRGIVATPNDFGLQGEKPTHPELLDYLASEFIQGGWKLKPLHRLIMNTAVYQLGGNAPESNRQRDPENKFFGHRSGRRLEAEAIRDSLLRTGGKLDLTQFGPSLSDVTAPRRSVYLRVKRSELIPFLALFDAPEPAQSIGERGNTTLPTQALSMLNSPFVRSASKQLATRVLKPGQPPERALIEAFQIALSRPPTEAELSKFGGYLQSQLGEKPTPATLATAMERTCHVLLCTNEFLYVD